MIQSLVTFIIIFGIIVCVHEYGHLFFAKKAGILVREFSIGMGPKIYAHQRKMAHFIRFEFCLWAVMFAWLVGVKMKLRLRLEHR